MDLVVCESVQKEWRSTFVFPEYVDDVGDTNAILKLVTNSHPEIPCLWLLTEANLRTFEAEATITSPDYAIQ